MSVIGFRKERNQRGAEWQLALGLFPTDEATETKMEMNLMHVVNSPPGWLGG